MNRRVLSALVSIVVAFAPLASFAQSLPDSLRSAGVTVAQWSAVTAEVHRVSASLGISEKTLITVAQIAGLKTAKNGVVDVERLIGRISDLAAQVKALQDQLTALEKTNDTKTASLLARAQTAINAGDLDAAEQLLGDARKAARAATTQAQLREAEVIGAQARVKSLRSDDLGAAELYAEAAETVPPSETHARWEYVVDQALALARRGEVYGEPEPLRRAIQVYQASAVPLVPRERAPADWAQTQTNLGIALLTLGELGDDQALKDAITAYRGALEVYTRDRAPADWAATQTNLGAALATLGERGDDQALKDAITAYRGTLEVLTRDRAPADWALIQNNLGIALFRLGEHGDDQALKDAITAYRGALEVRIRDRAPEDWAQTQNNLGSALFRLGERGDDQAVKDAITAYRGALEVLTRNRAPAYWAGTQNNLGNALETLGERGDDQALKDAITAYRGALEGRTRDRAPADWALTQNNLGHALEVEGDKGGRRASYEAAVECYKGALEVFTPESNRTEHDRTQRNLERIMMKLAGKP